MHFNKLKCCNFAQNMHIGHVLGMIIYAFKDK